MDVIDVLTWAGALAVVVACVALALVAVRRSRPLLATPALVPIVFSGVLLAGGVSIYDPSGALSTLTALGMAALGVIAGGPLTTLLLSRVGRGDSAAGAHGGILVADPRAEGVPREVLRGGSVIGYLERFAIVAGVAVGHPEVVAVVVAIKGLGRFSDLSDSAAQERFIIGTLSSMIWATVCGALIWLPHL